MTNRFLTIAPLLVFVASPLHANLTGVDLFKNVSYTQTSGAAPSTPAGYFVSMREFFSNTGDFNTGSVTYPGPASPQALSLDAANKLLIFQTGFLPDKATMDAQYPFGTYHYTATNSGTSASESADLSYTQDAYALNIPAFTAGTIAALQAGVYAGGPLTLNFNAETVSPNANAATTFVSIFGPSGSQNGLPTSATSFTIAANTLTPGTTYTVELDFSDRIGANPGVPTTVGFDVRTDVTFTTLSPEPGTLGLGVLGMGALAFALRRRRIG